MKTTKQFIYTILTLITIFFICCSNDDESPKLNIPISNLNMVDIGQTTPTLEINIEKQESIIKFEITTFNVKIGDEIAQVSLSQKGRDLEVKISTTPYDFDCSDNSCFSNHKITFETDKSTLVGTYNVILIINNGYQQPIEYDIK